MAGSTDIGSEQGRKFSCGRQKLCQTIMSIGRLDHVFDSSAFARRPLAIAWTMSAS